MSILYRYTARIWPLEHESPPLPWSGPKMFACLAYLQTNQPCLDKWMTTTFCFVDLGCKWRCGVHWHDGRGDDDDCNVARSIKSGWRRNVLLYNVDPLRDPPCHDLGLDLDIWYFSKQSLLCIILLVAVHGALPNLNFGWCYKAHSTIIFTQVLK